MKTQNESNEPIQDLINEVTTSEVWTKEGFMEKFYPEVYAQEQADLNLSLVVGK